MLEPADWLKVDVRSGAGRSLKAPLFRAIGVKKGYRPRVLDATAGYGIDAWLMAAAGCEVVAVERVAEVYKALEKSHAAARAVEPETAGRITLRFGDALDVMRDVDAVDVIYMDPMFAAERKAAPKRAMVELAEAVGGEADIDEVGRVAAAGLRIARRRMVIKRAARAPAIELPDGRAADVVYQGRGFRFDVYVNK
ncbi:class I SAM-dependent methyltransferase [Planctomycetales bacterium ZRK34]|nr:class I SAM-dependent methyltransferase [Planctomycetales bacterium ZRK34]